MGGVWQFNLQRQPGRPETQLTRIEATFCCGGGWGTRGQVRSHRQTRLARLQRGAACKRRCRRTSRAGNARGPPLQDVLEERWNGQEAQQCWLPNALASTGVLLGKWCCFADANESWVRRKIWCWDQFPKKRNQWSLRELWEKKLTRG